MATNPRRWFAAGGIVGPIVFVAAWAVLGARRTGYSPVDDPISRLAAVGATGRVTMTAAFVAFAVGVALYSVALRAWLPGAAATAAVATALTSLAVASVPLGSSFGDRPHGAAAGAAYLSLVGLTVAGGCAFARDGRRRAAAVSFAVGAAAALALLTSVLIHRHTGLWQRAGLTVGDLWIAGTGIAMLRRGRAFHRRTAPAVAAPDPAGTPRVRGRPPKGRSRS